MAKHAYFWSTHTMATTRTAGKAPVKAATPTTTKPIAYMVPMYVIPMQPGDDRPARVMWGLPDADKYQLDMTLLPATPRQIGYASTSTYGKRFTLALFETDNRGNKINLVVGENIDAEAVSLPGISHLIERPSTRGASKGTGRYLYQLYSDRKASAPVEQHLIEVEEADRNGRNVWVDHSIIRVTQGTTPTVVRKQPTLVDDGNAEAMLKRAQALAAPTPTVADQMDTRKAQAIAALSAAGVPVTADNIAAMLA